MALSDSRRPVQGSSLGAAGCEESHPVPKQSTASFQLCSRAGRQHCAEKQYLPLALNQLWGAVGLTHQVDRVLQVNGGDN